MKLAMTQRCTHALRFLLLLATMVVSVDSYWAAPAYAAENATRAQATERTDLCNTLPGTTHSLLLYSLQASNGQYLRVDHGGGEDRRLYADRPEPRSHETFWLIDLDGGGLQSGDRVRLCVADTGYFVRVSTKANHFVADSRKLQPPWTSITIYKVGGGDNEIKPRDKVALYFSGRHAYMSALHGGGGPIILAGCAGAWETFTLQPQWGTLSIG